jgi:SNF2 family DNA or RNA helicase
MQLELRPYQLDAFGYLAHNRCAALFADPGLGKTVITLTLIRALKHDPQFRGVLLLAPLRTLRTVWQAEIRKWDQFNHLTSTILTRQNGYVPPGYDIYLLGIESMHWIFPYLKAAHLPFNLLVIDELSKFKNHTSKRFKGLAKYIGRFPRRIGLTGSPASRSLMNLFSQSYLIDEGAAFGRYVTRFRERYFYQHPKRRWTWNLFPGAEDEIYRKTSTFAMRIDKADHLDLPPLLYNPIEFDLPPKAKKIYKDVKDKMFAEIDGAEKLISTASAKYAILRQVANGQLLNPEGIVGKKDVLWLHDEKIKALIDLIDELQGKPLLVAYHYRADFRTLQSRLEKALGHPVPYIGSGIGGAQTDRIVAEWNLGLHPVLLGQPQSMGHGLNMQEDGTDIAWFGLTDDCESFDQFNARIHRSGVKQTVTVHLLMARYTIDWVIRDRLTDKQRTQESLLDMLREYQRKDRQWQSNL